MTTLILIFLTWYLTKLFYTKNPLFTFPEALDANMITAKCSKCSQTVVTIPDNLRVPFYCLACK